MKKKQLCQCSKPFSPGTKKYKLSGCESLFNCCLTSELYFTDLFFFFSLKNQNHSYWRNNSLCCLFSLSWSYCLDTTHVFCNVMWLNVIIFWLALIVCLTCLCFVLYCVVVYLYYILYCLYCSLPTLYVACLEKNVNNSFTILWWIYCKQMF